MPKLVNTMPKIIKTFAGFYLILISYCPAFAQEEIRSAAADAMKLKAEATLELASYRPATECAKDGVAVGGYDLISYRDEGGPRFGSAEFTAEYGDNIYLFETAEKRDRFLADPMQYLPSYGGWCAISLALGGLTCPDYSIFKIENGDLLLFEVTAFTNGRALWNTDPPGHRKKADTNYDRFMEE